MDPVFEVNPFLAQGAAKESQKIARNASGCGPHGFGARPWEQPVAGQDRVTFFIAAIIDN